MKVVIDGITYVPAASVAHAAEAHVMEAVRQLATLYYLYGYRTMSRGQRGCVFEALQALAPNIADLVAAERFDEAVRAVGAFPEES